MDALEYRADGLDTGRILAWMLFPHDEKLRQHHFAREIAKQHCASTASDLTVPRDVLVSLIDGPGSEEIGRLAADATKQGTAAGDLVSLYYQQHALGHDEPSFGKAIAAYKEFAIGQQYGDGEALKYSEQTLRNYLHAYRKVAHLWGAFRLAGAGPYAYVDDKRSVFHDPAAQEKFLGVAKSVAEFLTTFVPKRTKPPSPLFSEHELLALPESIAPVLLVTVDRSKPR